MTKETRYLIDKSALVRLGQSADVDAWLNRIERGLVSISTVTRLEVGFSARNGTDYRRVTQGKLMRDLPLQYLTPAIENRAVEVQKLLAERGQHRAPSIPDLLIAATGEKSGLTVLHVDKDFDLIAELTGQPVERLRF